MFRLHRMPGVSQPNYPIQLLSFHTKEIAHDRRRITAVFSFSTT